MISCRYLGPTVVLIAISCLATAQAVSSSRRSQATTHAKSAATLGTFADNVYRNRFFGFSYQVPFGWVDRSEDMRQESRGGASDNADLQSVLLLSAFERPPEASGDTVNSSVLIAAESLSTYPGLKDPSQYFGPLDEVTSAKGFKVVNEPYDVEAGGRHMVRADYSKEVGKTKMCQSTLVILAKEYVISFTFVGGSEDEVEELVGHLAWSTMRSSADHQSKPTN